MRFIKTAAFRKRLNLDHIQTLESEEQQGRRVWVARDPDRGVLGTLLDDDVESLSSLGHIVPNQTVLFARFFWVDGTYEDEPIVAWNISIENELGRWESQPICVRDPSGYVAIVYNNGDRHRFFNQMAEAASLAEASALVLQWEVERLAGEAARK